MSEFFSLKGKRAAVTGGLGLIGRAVVKSFVEAGSETIVLDIDDGNGKELLSELEGRPGKAFYENFDITNLDKLAGNIGRLEEKYGEIDIWVNCAYPRTKDWGNRLEEVTVESWRKNVDLQLNSYCLSSNEIAKKMAVRGGGAIINIGSLYGVKTPDFRIYERTEMTTPAAYSAIKGGVAMYSRYLAKYYAPRNVRVNIVCPGGVFNGQPEPFVEKYSKKTSLGRMAKPEEIAGPVVFLASDAASYITGNVLLVDGGWTV